MERIPPSLILHRKADGADTRMASLRSLLCEAAPEKWLGVQGCGEYKRAANNPERAFEPVESMWTENTDITEEDSNHQDCNAKTSDVSSEEDNLVETNFRNRHDTLVECNVTEKKK